jgi:hypothetical protein
MLMLMLNAVAKNPGKGFRLFANQTPNDCHAM